MDTAICRISTVRHPVHHRSRPWLVFPCHLLGPDAPRNALLSTPDHGPLSRLSGLPIGRQQNWQALADWSACPFACSNVSLMLRPLRGERPAVCNIASAGIESTNSGLHGPATYHGRTSSDLGLVATILRFRFMCALPNFLPVFDSTFPPLHDLKYGSK
jgi:hypothetical protein